MDKYTVCADFLPGISEETLDTSFIHESIERYACFTNEYIVNEALKDVVKSAVDKVKLGAKAVWAKVKSGVIKTITQHFSRKAASEKKSQNETAESIDEVVGVFAGSDTTGTLARHYLDGLRIGCDVIYRNLKNVELEYDAAEKAFTDIKNGGDIAEIVNAFDAELRKIAKDNEGEREKLAKKFNIPKTNKKGEKISQLSYAQDVMTDSAGSKIDQKHAKEVADILTKRWNKILPYYDKLFKRGCAKDCELFKLYSEVLNKIPEDQHKYIEVIPRELASISDDMTYSWNDILFMSDKLNAAIWAVKGTIQESVGPRSVYYRLGESEVYKYCRNQETVDGAKLESNITRMVRDGQGFAFVGMNDLDKTVQYELFESNQYFNVGVSGAKRAMRNLIESGKVQMVYSDTYMVDVSIPYIITTGRTPRVFVNISHFVNPNQFGKYVITQVRNKNGLMAVLFAACVSYAIVSHYHTLNPDIGDPLVLMHAYMLTDVFDRMVHMDAIMKDKVRYLCTQFALVQMYGTEVGTKTFQRFRGKYFPKLSNMLMNSVDSQFTVDAFDNIQLFIDELVRVYPSMKKVTFKDVWKTWYRRYSNTAIMALDYIGYMIYILCELLYESPLVNRLALDPMLKAARGELALKTLQTMVTTVG